MSLRYAFPAMFLSLTACSGDDSAEPTGDPSDEPTTIGQPVLPKDDAPQGDGDATVVFGMNKLFLGDTNRDASPNVQNGWKQYGFNLDGYDSTENSTVLCQPRKEGTPATAYPDGDNGIDNSFGKNLMSTIRAAYADASTEVANSLLEGKFTIIVAIDKLGTGANYQGLPWRLYGGDDLKKDAKFDGTDVWPVRPELLKDPNDILSSTIAFDDSYVTDQTWVSGTPASVKLSLSIKGTPLTLDIRHAVLSMNLNADRTVGSTGQLGGIIEVDQFLSELRKIAGKLLDTCEGGLLDILEEEVNKAADILSTGEQDPSKECNAVSIGLGFEMVKVQLGEVGEASVAEPDPCK